MQRTVMVSDNVSDYQTIQPQILIERRPSVLVAEDDAARGAELRELLSLYDVAILEAHDGEAALDLIVRECPDLIFIKAALPKLNGYETARLIRSIKSFDETPIVFFSDEIENSFRRRAFAVGADSFHIAPLDFERLDRILEKFLFAAN